jgi:hypothetical protein
MLDSTTAYGGALRPQARSAEDAATTTARGCFAMIRGEFLP